MVEMIFYSNNDELIKRWQGFFDFKGLRLSSTVELLERASNGLNRIIFLDIASLDTPKEAFISKLLEKPLTKIFALTTTPQLDEGINLLKYKVSGYGNAYMAHGNLTMAVDVIKSGNIWIYPELVQALIRSSSVIQTSHPDKPSLELLSPKEQEASLLVAKGLSNKEIAVTMQITERTVKAHLSAIYIKLSIRDRLSLALLIKSLND